MASYKNEKKYTDVAWITSHNSFTYSSNDKNVLRQYLPNQSFNIKEQLQYGVRSFMIDIHMVNDQVVIAHSESMKFFEQPIMPFLEEIYNWLHENKDDIITIHFESYVKNYDKIYKTLKYAKLDKYLFDLNNFYLSRNGWPTLGDMRRNEKRLVIFSDKREDVGKGILHVSNYMETEYNLKDYPNCELRLGDGRARKSNLFVMNHFYPLTVLSYTRVSPSFPYISLDFEPNTYKRLNERICKCFKSEKKFPNFIAMDFIGNSAREDHDIIIKLNNNEIKCSKQYDHDEL